MANSHMKLATQSQPYLPGLPTLDTEGSGQEGSNECARLSSCVSPF